MNTAHGPKIITLGSNIFSARAADAIDAQPIRRTVHLAEIELLDEEKIAYKGTQLNIDKSAFGDLLKILKIPQAFIKRFGEMMAEKPEAKRNFINTIKNVMSTQGKGSTTVTLVLNKKDRKIVAVHKTARNLISNGGMLDVVNRVIDENGLEVVDFSVGSNGEVAVNAVNLKSAFDIDGLKDEVFHGGVSFVNNPKNGFIVSPYINRLVCANGMVSRGFQEQFKLTSTDGQAMQKFFSDMSNLAKSGFRPEKFVERVQEAHSLKASLSEMFKVSRAIKGAANDITKEEMESWVPVKYTTSAYHRIGVDTHLLRAGQLKNAKTDTSVWELINGLTHFATHDNGFEIDDYTRTGLQMVAGQLLSDEHDMANFVRSPFK
jgi:hypothetical protein